MAGDGSARSPPRGGARPASSRCRPSSPSRVGTPPTLFHRAVFVNATPPFRGQMNDCHARARGLCQVSMADAKRIIYDATASCDQRAERDARTNGWEWTLLDGHLVNDPLTA